MQRDGAADRSLQRAARAERVCQRWRDAAREHCADDEAPIEELVRRRPIAPGGIAPGGGTAGGARGAESWSMLAPSSSISALTCCTSSAARGPIDAPSATRRGKSRRRPSTCSGRRPLEPPVMDILTSTDAVQRTSRSARAPHCVAHCGDASGIAKSRPHTSALLQSTELTTSLRPVMHSPAHRASRSLGTPHAMSETLTTKPPAPSA